MSLYGYVSYACCVTYVSYITYDFLAIPALFHPFPCGRSALVLRVKPSQNTFRKVVFPSQ